MLCCDIESREQTNTIMITLSRSVSLSRSLFCHPEHRCRRSALVQAGDEPPDEAVPDETVPDEAVPDEAAADHSGEADGPAGRYTVRSVARALRLVEIVADGPADGRPLSDLARALGASKSTTLAVARTLTALGYLREIRPGPRYALGTALLRLGDIARQQLP